MPLQHSTLPRKGPSKNGVDRPVGAAVLLLPADMTVSLSSWSACLTEGACGEVAGWWQQGPGTSRGRGGPSLTPERKLTC